MNYKKGDIVQVLEQYNHVWSGVDMVVTRSADVDLRQSAVLAKHPTLGDGGFDSYALFLVKPRKSLLVTIMEGLANFFPGEKKPTITTVEESFADRLRKEATKLNKPKKKKAKKASKKKAK